MSRDVVTCSAGFRGQVSFFFAAMMPLRLSYFHDSLTLLTHGFLLASLLVDVDSAYLVMWLCLQSNLLTAKISCLTASLDSAHLTLCGCPMRLVRARWDGHVHAIRLLVQQ